MNYYIIGEKYHTHIGLQLNKPASWWPVGPPRESLRDSPTPYIFPSREEAQNYMDANKPKDKEWNIFFVSDDDYANF